MIDYYEAKRLFLDILRKFYPDYPYWKYISDNDIDDFLCRHPLVTLSGQARMPLEKEETK